MAVALASSASTTWTSATTIVITKPSSLAAGDLMVAVLSVSSGEFTTLSGWTLLQTLAEGTSNSRLNVQYKIADAGDVAASNFTFTSDSSNGKAGGILRITGGAVVGIVSTITAVIDDATPDFTGLTPQNSDSLCILAAVFRASGTNSMSGYAITTSNPTWTETFQRTTSGISMGCATASRPEVTATGIATITSAATTPESVGVIISVAPTVSATVAPDVVIMPASIQAPAVGGRGGVSPAVITLASSIQAPTIAAVEPDWSNQSKNPSTWANRTKS